MTTVDPTALAAHRLEELERAWNRADAGREAPSATNSRQPAWWRLRAWPQSRARR